MRAPCIGVNSAGAGAGAGAALGAGAAEGMGSGVDAWRTFARLAGLVQLAAAS